MIRDFKALQIAVASPQQVLSWSFGEVKKAETINYRTHRAEVDGLMDEKIFGPTKNFECYCGKYKKIRYKGIVCDKCGVEVTHKRVRRERLGHIKLASPVTHVWFSYGVPNKLSLILGIPQKKLETVIYFARYLVTDVDQDRKKEVVASIKEGKDSELKDIKDELKVKLDEVKDEFKTKAAEARKDSKDKKKLDFKLEKLTNDEKKQVAKIKSIYAKKEEATKTKYNQILTLVENMEMGSTVSEDDYSTLLDYDTDFFKAGMGAEAVKKVLATIDPEVELKKLQDEREKTRSVLKLRKIVQRLRMFEGMIKSGIDPTWLVLDVLPVIPPDLRPIIQLPGGRFATSDLNDLYRRVINRNNRLKRLIDLGAPEIILRNEKRMLQEAVDALIDNDHRPGNAVQNTRGQPYKSLSDMLRGKQGRFRQNLLGKRVDYSGRSVIVAGPELSIEQCGLPKTMALELFKPFVMREIILQGLAPNVKSAKHFFESRSSEVWDILEEVIKDRPVLLNRAPTLHKQGIQAFFPVLVEGDAIKLHPMVCTGFNADFDGDQMAVHVPLSDRAVAEAKEKMFPKSNLLLMSDGSPVVNVAKDMALGIYYMTGLEEPKDGQVRYFSSFTDVLGRYEMHDVTLRERIRVLHNGEILETCVGRILFNSISPDGFRFINEQVNKKGMAKISAEVLEQFGHDLTTQFLDKVEEFGFHFATQSGITVGMDDFVISPNKDKLLDEVEEKDDQLTNDLYSGLLTEAERKRLSEQMWMELIEKVAEDTWNNYTAQENNHLVTLQESGAVPVQNPLRQISGIRGLILDPLGNIVELPLRSNYKQGLSTLEYFVAARGTRKGLADTALKTAESGYLTRRLVDVAQDVITKEMDCDTENGFTLLKSSNRRIDWRDRIAGRFAATDVIDEKTGEVLVKGGEEITVELARRIDSAEIEAVTVRSVLTCETEYGVCQKCYGYNLGTRTLALPGLAVGVIAAQAMGEAATQLTLNTKHLAGRAGTDITQGLPRVEELFEARTPKAKAIISEIDGKVSFIKDDVDNTVGIKVSDHKKLNKTFEVGENDVTSIKRSKKIKKGEIILTRQDGEAVKAEMEGLVKKEGNIITYTVDKEVEVEYDLGPNDIIDVEDGDNVIKGTALTLGSKDPKEIMEFVGVEDTQRYLIDNIQETYGIQGIGLDDKHVEVVVRQMFRFSKVIDSGDTEYLPGDNIDHIRLARENAALKDAGKKPAQGVRQLLGITTSSIKTESFLSAASFQEQVRVLSDAALVGKVDELRGLKENVIIGRTVPLGSEVR
ncbi:MAG: DNA-directed RNA polymerase subunit beta' [candidate division WS6 bacterium OLB20]|uniref:DNA-directed RNA polymerase subunit beta' n=1 Tax=candidate division WS6 bacterium OLB20 TaxID=1617426 RepID=A0A136LZH8_9BACT|nr:MAG: DNA-directed RNA polymerase subunit beta' [candidate division WS6 bacterium OLB20]